MTGTSQEFSQKHLPGALHYLGVLCHPKAEVDLAGFYLLQDGYHQSASLMTDGSLKFDSNPCL